MALTAAQVGDYFILNYNVVPGTPKSGYTPVKGHLVRREIAQSNEWDLATTDETFSGIVVTVNPGSTRMGIAEFVSGTTVILPVAASLALTEQGKKVEATSTALDPVGTTGISRTRVVVDDTNGVGAIIAIDPAGPATIAVRF